MIFETIPSQVTRCEESAAWLLKDQELPANTTIPHLSTTLVIRANLTSPGRLSFSADNVVVLGGTIKTQGELNINVTKSIVVLGDLTGESVNIKAVDCFTEPSSNTVLKMRQLGINAIYSEEGVELEPFNFSQPASSASKDSAPQLHSPLPEKSSPAKTHIEDAWNKFQSAGADPAGSAPEPWDS